MGGGILGLGGVGHMGVKIAKAMGHHVTVISSSDKKRVEALEHLGADDYLVSSDVTRMRTITWSPWCGRPTEIVGLRVRPTNIIVEWCWVGLVWVGYF
ncbi:hypothetical protein CsSME_00039697 [Camellia sinensis var. sinensis]